jgi:hypothetical protein
MCFNSEVTAKRALPRITKSEILKGACLPHEPHTRHSDSEIPVGTSSPVLSTDEAIGMLLSELRAMREEQKKLHEELRLLKLQNERLESRLNLGAFTKQLEANTSQLSVANGRIAASLATLADRLNSTALHPFNARPTIDPDIINTLTSSQNADNGTSCGSLSVPSIAGSESSSNNSSNNTNGLTNSLIVVFDLTTKPATVMSATDNFCKMMGYAMHEVTGMPWHKFIHPNYIDRTMNIFNQTNLNTTVQFSQVYKTKVCFLDHSLLLCDEFSRMGLANVEISL